MGKPKIIFKNIYLWGLKGFSFRFPPSGGKPRLLQGWILGMQPQHSQLFVELGNFIVPRQGQGAVTSQMGLGGGLTIPEGRIPLGMGIPGSHPPQDAAAGLGLQHSQIPELNPAFPKIQSCNTNKILNSHLGKTREFRCQEGKAPSWLLLCHKAPKFPFFPPKFPEVSHARSGQRSPCSS